MEQRPRAGWTLVISVLLAGPVLATANVAFLAMSVSGVLGLPPLAQLYRMCPPCVTYYVAAPLVIATVVAIMIRRLTAPVEHGALPTTSQVAQAAAADPAAASDAALRLLGLLQREARLVDFIQEDIEGYSDQQVGAAVRSIHAGCRKALHERIELQRILTAEEGTAVVVEGGFDPAAVRLTGNVGGAPPFRGTLQHAGWQATNVSLPQTTGQADPKIIAPAEVEIP